MDLCVCVCVCVCVRPLVIVFLFLQCACLCVCELVCVCVWGKLLFWWRELRCVCGTLLKVCVCSGMWILGVEKLCWWLSI